MKEYMPILYALQSGKLKTEDFVEYNPDTVRYANIHNPGFFAFEGKSEKAEFDLGWNAVIYKDFGVLLVASKATKTTITAVNGCPSYNVLKSYAFLYENPNFESNSVVLTRELYKEIPESLRPQNVWVYSKEAYSSPFRRSPYHSSKRDPSRTHSYRNTGPRYYTHNMLPVVFIPSDTIIEIEDGKGLSQEKAFKLHPRKYDLKNTQIEYFEKPMWVSLVDAMMARKIFDTDFVEYVSDKSNELIIKKVDYADKHALDGWKPILHSDDDVHSLQIVSASFDCFKTDVWDDILQENIKCSLFDNCNQHESNVKLLEIYAKLDASKVKMVISISDKVMVEINNPEYDGSTPTKAYRLKVESKN